MHLLEDHLHPPDLPKQGGKYHGKPQAVKPRDPRTIERASSGSSGTKSALVKRPRNKKEGNSHHARCINFSDITISFCRQKSC